MRIRQKNFLLRICIFDLVIYLLNFRAVKILQRKVVLFESTYNTCQQILRVKVNLGLLYSLYWWLDHSNRVNFGCFFLRGFYCVGGWYWIGWFRYLSNEQFVGRFFKILQILFQPADFKFNIVVDLIVEFKFKLQQFQFFSFSNVLSQNISLAILFLKINKNIQYLLGVHFIDFTLLFVFDFFSLMESLFEFVIRTILVMQKNIFPVNS